VGNEIRNIIMRIEIGRKEGEEREGMGRVEKEKTTQTH
jgi:hypothetical protein